jgi:hypothetical protein
MVSDYALMHKASFSKSGFMRWGIQKSFMVQLSSVCTISPNQRLQVMSKPLRAFVSPEAGCYASQLHLRCEEIPIGFIIGE